MLKSGLLRHVTSRDTRFISVHDNRTPIGSKLPIMGEFVRLKISRAIMLSLLTPPPEFLLLFSFYCRGAAIEDCCREACFHHTIESECLFVCLTAKNEIQFI